MLHLHRQLLHREDHRLGATAVAGANGVGVESFWLVVGGMEPNKKTRPCRDQGSERPTTKKETS